MDINDYICNVCGIDNIQQYQPYAQCTAPSWDRAEDVVIQMRCHFDGETRVQHLSPENTVLPRSAQAQFTRVNLDRVYPKSIMCTHKSSNANMDAYIKLTYTRVFEDTELHDMINAAMDRNDYGGCFMEVQANTDTDCRHASQRSVVGGGGHTNAEFIKSTAFLSEANLRNGILQLPKEVCVEALQRPEETIVYTPEEGRPEIVWVRFEDEFRQYTYTPQHYYLVPENHVLAWPCRTADHERRKRGIAAYEHRVRSENNEILLYYLIGDKSFELLYRRCVEQFCNNADCRPLTDLGMQLVPKSLDTPFQGSVDLMFSITFVAFPLIHEDDVLRMTPSLSRDFLPYSTFRPDEVQMASFEKFTK